MQYLEEHDIGFDTGVAKVPLVVQSDIYDLTVGSKRLLKRLIIKMATLVRDAALPSERSAEWIRL